MRLLIMSIIVGVVVSILCLTGNAERLYTWQDDKGITHISKEAPPQNTKLIDIMDYTVTPATKAQTTVNQGSNEDEKWQPQRIGIRETGKVSRAGGTADDVDEDVVYDGDRYRRREKRHERREARQEGHEDRREGDHPPGEQPKRQIHRRK